MKKRILAALAVAAAAPLFAQTANRATSEKQILAHERAVNTAFEKRDAAAIQKHLLSEGVAVDPMGVATVADVLKMLRNIKVSPGWKIDSSRVQWIDDNTAVHIYRWTGKGTIMGQPMPSPTWSSTVWVMRNGRWRAAFHQETAAMAPPSPPPPAKK